MSCHLPAVAVAIVSIAVLAPINIASAAESSPAPIKAPPVADLPFFSVNDNYLTYSYLPNGTDPGVPGETQKQAYSFSHFDAWAYGTNFLNVSLIKSDHGDPANPCGNYHAPVYGCAGATEILGLVRSTFDWNEIFNTRVFAMGPLHSVSFEAGLDVGTKNNFEAPSRTDIVAGLQFAFDLPYRGYFNVAPLFYQEWNHDTFLTPAFTAPYPGIPDGNTRFNPTWAVELNYYMDLGFLPPSLRYFAISGRAGFYGPKGTGAAPGIVAPYYETKTEIKTEPIRLTLDASKALWGQKYSQMVQLFVAYRYWENKFGHDNSNPADRLCFTAGVNNGSCAE
ncbi:MAG: hypothetical protein ACLQDM_27910, partial [Bradyrhizobium sp.]